MDVRSNRNDNRFCNNTIEGVELESDNTVKDLGITVDSHLKFQNHIHRVVSDARKRSYLIYKCFECKAVKSLLIGYKSYILPVLNYCTPVWSPSTVHEINLIESVQRKFTKKIPGLSDLPYRERLLKLKIPPLELRRLWNDLVFCYKILNNLVVGPPER